MKTYMYTIVGIVVLLTIAVGGLGYTTYKQQVTINSLSVNIQELEDLSNVSDTLLAKGIGTNHRRLNLLAQAVGLNHERILTIEEILTPYYEERDNESNKQDIHPIQPPEHSCKSLQSDGKDGSQLQTGASGLWRAGG